MGGDTADSGGQGGETALQCRPVEPANVTRLEWISGEDGELPEAVRLGEVGIMTARRGGSVAGIEVAAGEGGRVHFVCFVGFRCRGKLFSGERGTNCSLGERGSVAYVVVSHKEQRFSALVGVSGDCWKARLLLCELRTMRESALDGAMIFRG